MKRAKHVGFWSVIVGTLLFGGAVLSGPAGACIPAVGRDHSAHIIHARLWEIQYTFLGRSCYVETTLLLGFVGFFLAVFGALLWSGSELVGEELLDADSESGGG